MAPTPRDMPLDSNLARILAQKLKDDQLVLFAGAGLSHLALPKDGSERRIPLWAELTDTVASRFGIDSADFRGLPLDLFDAVIYAHSRSDLEKAVTTALDDREFELSPAHRALSELPWYKVVTTNYDALLSRLLDESYPIVDEPGYDRLQESKVIQIHGKLPHPHTLTRDDYRRWADHDNNPRAAQALRDFVLSHTLLFVGYSLSDPHIDELLALVRKWTKDRGKRLYGLFWQMPDAKRELLDRRDKITAVSINTPEEWENAFRQIKAEYDQLSAKRNSSSVEMRDKTPFSVKSQPVISPESLSRQIGTDTKTPSSVTSHEAILPDDSCFSNFAPQPHLATSLPPELVSQIKDFYFEQFKQFGIIQMPRENSTDSNSEDPALHAKIDAYRDLFKDDKQVLLAQEKLLKLLDTESLDTKPWARFRIETNLGAIAFELGNKSEGITRFEAAYAIRPDDSKAVANLALARANQGHYEEAMELAQRALNAEPRADHAVCYLLQAAAHFSWQGNPETLIPSDLLGSEPADIGLAEFLRRRNAPDWAERTLELSRRHPEADFFKLLKAVALLSLAVDDQGMIVPRRETVSMKELNAAADDLKAHVERHIAIGYADHSDFRVHLNNAAVLLRLTDRHAECEALLNRSLQKIPPDSGLTRLLALAQAIQGKYGEAIATLENVSDPENQLFKAELISTDKPAIALESLLEIDPTSLNPRSAQHRLELIGELALKKGEIKTLELSIATLREQFPSAEISAELLELRRELITGMGQDTAQEWLRAMTDLLSSKSDLATRYSLAEEMRNQGLPEEASRLLEGFVNLSRVNPLTTLYLACLAVARRDQAFRDALASAAPAVRESPAILWIVAAHAWNSNDLDTAFSAIERLIHHSPEVPQGRLLKIDILLRQDRMAEARAELNEPVEALDWRVTQDACRIASLLAHFGYIERGVAFTYRLFLKHRDETPAWMTLFSILFRIEQKEGEDSVARWCVERVALDTAVDLRYDDGENIFFIVESDPALLQIDTESLEPEHRLVKTLMGLEVGDRFVDADGREGTVTQLRHKYIARLHYIKEHYEKRFPEIFGIRRMRVEPTRPDGLNQFIEELKAHRESLEQEQEHYLRQNWPLGVLAHRLGHDTIEVAPGLARQGIPLKVAVGNSKAREEAAHMVQENARKGCVLDLLALWTTWRLQALEVVAEICGPIHLPRSVMDRLQARREKIDLSMRNGQRSASYEDGKIACLEVAPEVVRLWRDDLDALIAWVEEHTTICPTLAGEDLPSELREFLRAGNSDLFDSLIVAKKTGVLLVSDDLPTRELGREIGVPGVWLQSVFWIAQNQGLIDFDTFTRWIANLVDYGQDYTSVTGEMLIRALQLDAEQGEVPGYFFKTLIKPLGGKTAEPVSHLLVCIDCLKFLWTDWGAVGYREPATGLLLRQLIHDRHGDYVQILRVLFKWAWPIEPLWDYLLGWAKGHFLLQDLIAKK
jgi:tetratricopeptide (TPR) repeat protein